MVSVASMPIPPVATALREGEVYVVVFTKAVRAGDSSMDGLKLSGGKKGDIVHLVRSGCTSGSGHDACNPGVVGDMSSWGMGRLHRDLVEPW